MTLLLVDRPPSHRGGHEILTNTSQCQTCGRPIAEDDLGGLCASCMLKLAVEDGSFDSPEVSPHTERPLLNIPGYEVREEIARGGMGIVYRAVQLEPRRDVALKMLLPYQAGSPGMLERFRLEARAIAALEHPAILPVHHVGEHNGLPFFTMKLAAGGTLAQRKELFTGRWRGIAELMATLADAVQFAHERGVLHRDLKPGNVLFDEAGRAYVSDFGLAKLVGADTDLTRSVDLLGTPHYVAPEVAARSAKEARTASDIYSLGAILYELLAGRPPFEAEGVPALLKKIAEEKPVPPSRLRSESRLQPEAHSKVGIASAQPGAQPAKAGTPYPRDLEVICLKCLAKEPARRYATARELADDLRRWMDGRPILARPATRFERVHSWARRNPALASMSAVLAVVLIAGIIWEARSNRKLQRALSESLVRQARLERSSGHTGQRFETLALVARAVRHSMSPSNAVALRTEVAGALALPDLRTVSRWPVHVSHFENDFDFTANLDRYITGAADGGFTVFSTADHKPLQHFSGVTNNPAVRLRLSPDGRWAAAQFQNGQLQLHSILTNSAAASRESVADVRSPALSRDTAAVGRWLGNPTARAFGAFAPSSNVFAAVAIHPGTGRVAEVIDLETGRTRMRVPAQGALTLAFDESAAHLAVAGANLSVWRLVDTNQVWSVPLTHEASAVAWSPDARQLAVALERRRPTGTNNLSVNPVLIFDAANGRQEFVFAESDSRVNRLGFHPGGEWLAAAAWESIMMGAAEPGGLKVETEAAHRALAFSAEGNRLACAPTQDELAVLEVALPTAYREFRANSPPARGSYSLAVSADGRLVLSASSEAVQLWDVERRVELAAHPLPVKPWWVGVLFGPGDEFIYYSAHNFGVRRVTLVRTNAPDGTIRAHFGAEQMIGEPKNFLATKFASDSRSLVVGQNHKQTPNERTPPTVWLWPNADPNRARKLAEAFPLNGYYALPGGRWGMSTDLIAPDVWIWNFETGERIRNLGIPLAANSEPVPNGRWLVTRTRQEFAVWEVGTWEKISQWPTPAAEADTPLRPSPDSRLLATHAANGQIILRELPDGKELVHLPPPRVLDVSHYQFSPDSSRLFVLLYNGRICEWNLAELRRELAKLKLDWRDSR